MRKAISRPGYCGIGHDGIYIDLLIEFRDNRHTVFIINRREESSYGKGQDKSLDLESLRNRNVL